MELYLRKILLVFFLGLFVTATTAGQDDCPAVVENALASTDQWCQATSRNQVCYGNNQITAQLQPGFQTTTFDQVGDIVDVTSIQRLQLSAMDTEAEIWGIALFRIQANLPDTLPGQNVTMLLFGDIEIYPADPATTELAPMQAFYMRSGIGDAACAQVPDSGLLVQTPVGMGQISLVINEVQIQMGSTVYFQAQPGDKMIVRTVEGAARVQVGDDIETAIAGTQVEVPLDENGIPSAPPENPTSYLETDVAALPIGLLEREIEIEPPLPEKQLELLLAYEAIFEAISIESQGALLAFLAEDERSTEELLDFLANELLEQLPRDLQSAADFRAIERGAVITSSADNTDSSDEEVTSDSPEETGADHEMPSPDDSSSESSNDSGPDDDSGSENDEDDD